MMPFFTIIITTYNRANLLEHTLKSLTNQTFTNFELIVIDNYSTDDTLKVIKQFNNLNLKFFQLENNGIISISRNFAISKSSSEWIAFLDSDDLWSENKLQKCFDLINKSNNKIYLIYHGMNFIKNDQIFGKLKTRKLSNPIFNDLLVKGNTIVFSSVVVKKDLLLKVNGFSCSKSMITTADYNTWLKIAQCGYEFTYLPKSLGSYRIHDGNLSNHNFFLQVIEAVKEFFPIISTREQYKIRNLQMYAQAMIYNSQKRFSDSQNILKKIIFRESFVFWFKSKIRLLELFFIMRKTK
jgi:glycosyltransferase involved in cell wall biosynthesis